MGHRRIHVELIGLGHRFAAATVWNILHRAGLAPAPRRSGPTWREFCRAQATTMPACDFVTVEAVLRRRVDVLFVLQLGTGRVHILGATRHPTGGWVTQQARNFRITLGEGANGVRFLIHDRDAKFAASFDTVFAAAGVRVVRSRSRAPRANGYAERWINTLRRECLDRLLVFHERQLRSVLAQYEDHYNQRRPHRSLDQRPPVAASAPSVHKGPIDAVVHRRDVLGNLIHEYRPAA